MSDPAITSTPSSGGASDKGSETIMVRALGHFHKEGDMKGDLTSAGEEFTTTRARAAQLRANGLVEYVNGADGREIHGEVEDKRLTERQKQATAMRGGLREKDKTTPLVNPKVEMAEAPKA